MEKFIFNPLNNKSPRGACVENTKVKYDLKILKFEAPACAYFVMHKDGENPTKYLMNRLYTDDKYVHFEYEQKYEESGFYWYHFEVDFGSWACRLIRSDNLDVIDSPNDNDYLQLVISQESMSNNSFKKGIIYHIFVDRFYKSGEVVARKPLKLCNDWTKQVEVEYNEKGERTNEICYGGNLQGVIDKLDYLKSLGVSMIYLSPIFEANSSHKYDVADYSKVDSMFGNIDILKSLISSAKKRGINIIIDGVFNHTGSDSVYFNKLGRYRTIGAYQNPNSKYYSWYDFSEYPDKYSMWWGIKTLPQTREDSGFFDYIAGKCGIIERYMSLGLSGFRLDVVDELSNNFLHKICCAARKINPKAYMVGEVWEDASSKISYSERKTYFLGGNLDSVTNYPMKNAILEYVKFGKTDHFVSVTNVILDQYPKSIQDNLMNILDTHDTVRALTYLGAENLDAIMTLDGYKLTDDERAKAKKLLKMATIIQYTIIGIPTIFYGDEAGMEGVRDPFCRAPYPWGKEDAEMLKWYQGLGELRALKVFDGGDMSIIYAGDGILIYERTKKDKKAIIAINRSSHDFDITLGKTMCDYFEDNYLSGKVTLKSDTFKVYVNQKS